MEKRKNEQKMFCTKKMAVFLVLCMVICGLAGQGRVPWAQTAMAAEKNDKAFGLKETSISLYVGNTYQLETVNAEPAADDFWGWYSASYYSSDMNIVRVDSNGLLRAVGAGQADIIAYYLGQSATCRVKVKANYCKLDQEKLTLYQGQEATVTLTNSKQKAVGYESFVYIKGDNYESNWSLETESKGKGVFTIKAHETGQYYLDLSLTNKKGVSYSARCEVEVLECGFGSDSVAVAEGGTIQLEAVNGEILSCETEEERNAAWEDGWEEEGTAWEDSWEEEGTAWEDGWEEEGAVWESDGEGNRFLNTGDSNQASSWDIQENGGLSSSTQKEQESAKKQINQTVNVSADGKLTGISEGQERLFVRWRAAYGEEREEWLTVYVTKPEYVPFEGKLFAGEWYYPKFTGTRYCSKVEISSSNKKVVEITNYPWGEAVIAPKKEGTATLKFTVDGVKFQQKVQVIDPKWGQDCALVKKGKSRSLAFQNLPKDCKVIWETSNKKVVTVSEDGKITGKKAGSAVITATLEGKTFACTVTVGSGTGLAAALKGEEVIGAIYSQEKRMQKGYYDCSSFVWRSYDAAGLKLCGVNYAPTAAELAKKLEKEGKAIAYEYVEADELKPGDLIFYAGGNNGRYKNIDHVSMYYGDYYSWEDMNSGAIVHAAGGGVQMEPYAWYRAGGIVMIVRPVK